MRTDTSSEHRSIASAMVAVSMLATLSCQAGPTSQASSTQPADTIYIGGDIVTVNDAQPAAEALAVQDGKIVAVGARADVEKAHKGAATQVVDLGGKTLMPGFIDAHGHYVSALTVANQVNLYTPPAGPGTDPNAIVRALLTFKNEKKVAPGELIQAYGYDENVMPKGNLLNRDHLDKAFPDNPIVVGHVSMHGAVLNSLALEKYGYSAAYKTPPGGVVVRKPGSNEPYGLIMETAYLPVFSALPKPTREQEASWSTAGQMLYAQAGLTLAHEGATHAAGSPWPSRTSESSRRSKRGSPSTPESRRRHSSDVPSQLRLAVPDPPDLRGVDKRLRLRSFLDRHDARIGVRSRLRRARERRCPRSQSP